MTMIIFRFDDALMAMKRTADVREEARGVDAVCVWKKQANRIRVLPSSCRVDDHSFGATALASFLGKKK